jgi:predicted metal-dependent peptidase
MSALVNGDADTAANIIKAERMIGEARTTLMLDAPFYGAIALRLSLHADPRKSSGTCATDGRGLYYNPDWIVTLKPRALVGLIAHEVMHIACKHTLRREGRNPRDWNIACDHAINNDLTAERFELPDDGMNDSQFRGWAAEEIFPHVARPASELPQPTRSDTMGGAGKGSGKGQGKAQSQGASDDESDTDESGGDDAAGDDGTEGADSGGDNALSDDSNTDGASGGGAGGDDGEPLPAGGVLDSPDPVADEAELDVAIIQAGMVAQACGKLPGHLKRLIDGATRTSVDFAALLAEFVERTMRDDYSMSRPNRRYMQAGVYLPSLHSEATQELAFMIDTSGSINNAQLSVAVNAVNECVEQCKPERVHVYCCDTRVHWQRTFERGERIEVNTDGGGGGTSFAPPFDALAADGVQPACALYFTADACGWFGADPGFPVLWMVERGAQSVPWGQRVEMPPTVRR